MAPASGANIAAALDACQALSGDDAQWTADLRTVQILQAGGEDATQLIVDEGQDITGIADDVSELAAAVPASGISSAALKQYARYSVAAGQALWQGNDLPPEPASDHEVPREIAAAQQVCHAYS